MNFNILTLELSSLMRHEDELIYVTLICRITSCLISLCLHSCWLPVWLETGPMVAESGTTTPRHSWCGSMRRTTHVSYPCRRVETSTRSSRGFARGSIWWVLEFILVLPLLIVYFCIKSSVIVIFFTQKSKQSHNFEISLWCWVFRVCHEGNFIF